MQINESQLNTIIERVVENLGQKAGKSTCHPRPRLKLSGVNSSGDLVQSKALDPRPSHTAGQSVRGNDPQSRPSVDAAHQPGVFPDIDSAIKALQQANRDLQDVSVAQRKKFIEAIRNICRENVNELSALAVDETKMGRYEDKIQKNLLAIEKTPGVEDVEAHAYSGDYGLSLQEPAPFGLIGAIAPCTNATETLICNGIGMLAGGNVVVFNPHPAAKRSAAFTVGLFNKAIISEGGPPNLITTVSSPTVESAQYMMKHPNIRLVVVTGGPAVVKVAMNSGKRVVAAGPGNPPVVVDETADIEKAGRDIVLGAGLDNNIICVIEKEIIAVEKIADSLKEALVAGGAVELNRLQAQRLEKVVLEPDRKSPNKKWVGKDIQLILKEIGLEVGLEKRIAFAEVPADHPFATVEMLLPVLGFVRAKDIDDAIGLAYKLEDGCFHTAGIHSKNIENLHKMAVAMNTSIFVKNAPFYAGLGMHGEGPASFTIASPTGEGLTTARHFTRMRRCVVAGYFRIT